MIKGKNNMMIQKKNFIVTGCLLYKTIELLPEMALSINWVQTFDITFTFSFLIFHLELNWWR
jgi:hypothetical protein